MSKFPKRLRILVIVVLFIIYSFFIYRLGSNPTSMISTKTNDPYLARFIENYNVLKENWYYFTSPKEVIGAATDALTNSNEKNDVYSEYIPPSDSREYFESMESSYVGFGIQYLMLNGYPLLSKVYNNSPAAKANLKIGDTLVEVDGKSLHNLKTADIQKIVQGEVGEQRKAVILRGNKKINVTVTLANIDSSVSYRLIDKTGYINLDEFSQTSPTEMKKALEYFKAKKVKKVIIDLRDNPGGYLDALEEIADLFLSKDKIVIGTKDKKGTIQNYKTVDDTVYKNDYVILTNDNTASAAEALTACLNENLNIKIYGEKTFGKGIMQGYFEYKDKGYLKYTNAEWLTPKGNAINKKGIKPTNPLAKSTLFQVSELVYDNSKDIAIDSVSSNLISYQKALKALGYNVDRIDGYYSVKTSQAITKFKKDTDLSSEKALSRKVQAKILERIFVEKAQQKNDKVLNYVLK